jgi:hypothetical protein
MTVSTLAIGASLTAVPAGPPRRSPCTAAHHGSPARGPTTPPPRVTAAPAATGPWPTATPIRARFGCDTESGSGRSAVRTLSARTARKSSITPTKPPPNASVTADRGRPGCLKSRTPKAHQHRGPGRHHNLAPGPLWFRWYPTTGTKPVSRRRRYKTHLKAPPALLTNQTRHRRSKPSRR